MSRERFASLAVVIVFMLDVYWTIAVMLGPRNIGIVLIAVGLLVQALGVAGLFAKANSSHALSSFPVWPLFLTAFIGSMMLWKGLFHSDEPRSSPSIWRSEILNRAPNA